MARLIVAISATVFVFLNTGCSISHPLLRSDYANYVGKRMPVETKAVLLSSNSWLPSYEIQAGKVDGSRNRVLELPVGTEVEIKSFWREHHLYLKGGHSSTDYALVKIVAPATEPVTAKLAVQEFGDVFDGQKYRPKRPQFYRE